MPHNNKTVQLIFSQFLKLRAQINIELFEEVLDQLIKEAVESLLEGNPRCEEKESYSTLHTLFYSGKERLMQFLSQCLPFHMRKNGRFSCYLNGPLCTWENPHFFRDIICNVDVHYREEEMSVEVPEHCLYYKSDQAIVMVLEKMV